MLTRGLGHAGAYLRAAGAVAGLAVAALVTPVVGGAVTTAAAAPVDFRLEAGESIQPGDTLTSPDGGYVLTQQHDGNLVLRGPDGDPMFNTITAGHPGATTTMQHDGNLVVTDTSGDVVFHTNTHDNAGAFLQVQTDGNLVIYQNDEALWSQHAWHGRLPSKHALAPNDYIMAGNGACQLVMQGDGNLVLQDRGGQPLFQTYTHGHPGARATMQADGNFVVTSRDGRVLFDTVTAGNPGASIDVQPDCNVVVRSHGDNKALWNTRTGRG